MNKDTENVEIDIAQILKAIKKMWWLLVALSVSLALAGFIVAKVTYIPQYTSTATFVVSNRTTAVGQTGTDQITSSDLSASSTLANTFKYILLSDEALIATIDKYALPYTIEKLKTMIDVSPVTGTNILKMSVQTPNAVQSKGIAESIIEYYPDVLSRTLKTASLEILNSPSSAETADKYSGDVQYTAIGFLLGLSIAILVLFVGEYYSDKIMTSSDIGNKLDIHVMATIPQINKKKKRGIKLNALLITNKLNGFSFIENYKSLRAKVENIAGKKGVKSIVVTSALENEGKTTVAVNLAIALVQNGKSVLLIDADMRKPAVLKLVELASNFTGPTLNDVLTGKLPLEQAIQKVDGFGFEILPCVSMDSHTSELLSSAKMKQTIDEATGKYDFVIVDTAPSALVADSTILTSYTDAVILVIRQDFASASDIYKEVQNLSDNKAELIGCVFNNVKLSSAGYGYKRKYSNYKNYGEVRENQR